MSPEILLVIAQLCSYSKALNTQNKRAECRSSYMACVGYKVAKDKMMLPSWALEDCVKNANQNKSDYPKAGAKGEYL